MTIRENSINIDDNHSERSNEEKELLNQIGVTKEQLLLKDLKSIAKEYVELESLKKAFSKILIKNHDELDFLNFINFPHI